MQPLISIITVTKNCASTIGRTLESVKTIKTPEVEYIIIDGLSTDATPSVIAQYQEYVDQLVSESDTGIYNAMNKGAALANGRYILFLNGDDHLLSDGFNDAMKILAEKRPEILSCVSEAIDENGVREKMLAPAPGLLRFFNTVPHLSTFVSASLQKAFAFREQYRIAADYDLFLRLHLARHQFLTSDAVTAVHYRGGFSSNIERAQNEVVAIRKENQSFIWFLISSGIIGINRFRKKMQNPVRV